MLLCCACLLSCDLYPAIAKNVLSVIYVNLTIVILIKHIVFNLAPSLSAETRPDGRGGGYLERGPLLVLHHLVLLHLVQLLHQQAQTHLEYTAHGGQWRMTSRTTPAPLSQIEKLIFHNPQSLPLFLKESVYKGKHSPQAHFIIGDPDSQPKFLSLA